MQTRNQPWKHGNSQVFISSLLFKVLLERWGWLDTAGTTCPMWICASWSQHAKKKQVNCKSFILSATVKSLGGRRMHNFLSLFSMLMPKPCTTHQQNWSGRGHFIPEKFDVTDYKGRKISVHPDWVNISSSQIRTLPSICSTVSTTKMSRRYREKCTEKWHEINFSFLRILLPTEAIYHLESDTMTLMNAFLPLGLLWVER